MENNEVTITNAMGHMIYTLAIESLARMIAFPSHDYPVRDELKTAKEVKKYMEYKFPELLDEETKKRYDKILEDATEVYNQRCEYEWEQLNRKLTYGKVTLKDIE